jgi:hypothetical protein
LVQAPGIRFLDPGSELYGFFREYGSGFEARHLNDVRIFLIFLILLPGVKPSLSFALTATITAATAAIAATVFGV